MIKKFSTVELNKYDFQTVGQRKKKHVNEIFILDVEVSGYLELYGEILPAIEYNNFSKKEKLDCKYLSCVYIFSFSINEDVYYCRTFDELEQFFFLLNQKNKDKKIIFVHNLSYEFQFLSAYFKFDKVFARKSRKVIYCTLEEYNIEFRCSYFMSNTALKNLPKVYNLPVQKLLGDLDYSILRNPLTTLTDDELKYCENDCLIVYFYIKTLLKINNCQLIDLPYTSTGFVRDSLKKYLKQYKSYYWKLRRIVNTEPEIYNTLVKTYTGAYVHSNFCLTDLKIQNVDSFDFASSYPFCMVSEKMPMSAFKKCNIKRFENMMLDIFCYMFKIKFYNIRRKTQNTFISYSKGYDMSNVFCDNGRIYYADEITLYLTEVDMEYLNNAYDYDKYDIIECYYAKKDYLPIEFVNFILDYYVLKTELKGIPEKEIEYNLIKNKFNSLYGMCVTNNIRDEVIFDFVLGWKEVKITNDEIEKKLLKENKKGFLNFAWGVYITSYARRNLINEIIKSDEFVIYGDTDSMKVTQNFNKKMINRYNKNVYKKLKKVSEERNIDFSRFAPADLKGHKHLIGVFEHDEHYDEFKTLGAKRYAYKKGEKIFYKVSGVPKVDDKKVTIFNNLDEFKDGFEFDYNLIKKNIACYNDEMHAHTLIDYLGNAYYNEQRKGITLVETGYKMDLNEEYEYYLSLAQSSERALYKEN